MVKRICFLIACLLFISILLTGCWDPVLRYSGEHMNLMAAAINSIPGVESSAEDQLMMLDTDEYGRTLFAVQLSRICMIRESYEECVLAVLIVQGGDESFSYVYGEQNYLMTILNEKTSLSEELIGDHFPEDKIASLKQRNDWNVAPEEVAARSICVPNTLEKEFGYSSEVDQLVTEIIGTNTRNEFFRQDQTGKLLFFILNINGESAQYEWYMVMIDSSGRLIDGENSYIRLDNIEVEEIADAIAVYMQNNQWKPITPQ